jgi:hypothetical protein
MPPPRLAESEGRGAIQTGPLSRNSTIYSTKYISYG